MFLGDHLVSQTRVLEDRNSHIEAHFRYRTNGLIYGSNYLILFTLLLHMYMQGLQKQFFPNVLVHRLGPIKEKGLEKIEGSKNI